MFESLDEQKTARFWFRAVYKKMNPNAERLID
jgi:CRISPR/Cas system CMR-associated protein Cmr1 (group 7 of RAMP superfamily)